MTSLSHRLQTMMQSRGMNRTQIAKAVNVSYARALRWLMLPDLSDRVMIEEVAQVLDICPDWLSLGCGHSSQHINRIPLYHLSDSRRPVSNVIARHENETSRILVDETCYFLPENTLLSIGKKYTRFIALKTSQQRIILANSDGNDNMFILGHNVFDQQYDVLGYVFNVSLQ